MKSPELAELEEKLPKLVEKSPELKELEKKLDKYHITRTQDTFDAWTALVGICDLFPKDSDSSQLLDKLLKDVDFMPRDRTKTNPAILIGLFKIFCINPTDKLIDERIYELSYQSDDEPVWLQILRTLLGSEVSKSTIIKTLFSLFSLFSLSSEKPLPEQYLNKITEVALEFITNKINNIELSKKEKIESILTDCKAKDPTEYPILIKELLKIPKSLVVAGLQEDSKTIGKYDKFIKKYKVKYSDASKQATLQTPDRKSGTAQQASPLTGDDPLDPEKKHRATQSENSSFSSPIKKRKAAWRETQTDDEVSTSPSIETNPSEDLFRTPRKSSRTLSITTTPLPEVHRETAPPPGSAPARLQRVPADEAKSGGGVPRSLSYSGRDRDARRRENRTGIALWFASFFTMNTLMQFCVTLVSGLLWTSRLAFQAPPNFNALPHASCRLGADRPRRPHNPPPSNQLGLTQ